MVNLLSERVQLRQLGISWANRLHRVLSGQSPELTVPPPPAFPLLELIIVLVLLPSWPSGKGQAVFKLSFSPTSSPCTGKVTLLNLGHPTLLYLTGGEVANEKVQMVPLNRIVRDVQVTKGFCVFALPSQQFEITQNIFNRFE
jgi:hypothetical protein